MSMVFGQKLKCFLRQITTKSISQGEQIGISFSFIAPSNFEQKDHKIKAPDYSPQFRPETEIFHCGKKRYHAKPYLKGSRLGKYQLIASFSKDCTNIDPNTIMLIKVFVVASGIYTCNQIRNVYKPNSHFKVSECVDLVCDDFPEDRGVFAFSHQTVGQHGLLSQIDHEISFDIHVSSWNLGALHLQ